MTDNLKELRTAVDRYLRGEVGGTEVVRCVDELVSSDKVYDMPEIVASDILELQNATAMYVADASKRAEHPAYIGDEELKEILVSFLRRIGGA